jgi:hypothetical protein
VDPDGGYRVQIADLVGDGKADYIPVAAMNTLSGWVRVEIYQPISSSVAA